MDMRDRHVTTSPCRHTCTLMERAPDADTTADMHVANITRVSPRSTTDSGKFTFPEWKGGRAIGRNSVEKKTPIARGSSLTTSENNEVADDEQWLFALPAASTAVGCLRLRCQAAGDDSARSLSRSRDFLPLPSLNSSIRSCRRPRFPHKRLQVQVWMIIAIRNAIQKYIMCHSNGTMKISIPHHRFESKVLRLRVHPRS